MDLVSLRRRLAEVNPALVQSVKVYFVNKRKVGLTAYIPNVHEEVRQELLEMYSETLLKPVFDLEQVAYNELGSIEDTIEVASLDQVNMEQTLNAILYQENQTQDLEQNMNIDDINYYMIQIAVGEEFIFIFKRFNKQKNFGRVLEGSLMEMISINLKQILSLESIPISIY